jgi:hypothetical protein
MDKTETSNNLIKTLGLNCPVEWLCVDYSSEARLGACTFLANLLPEFNK